MDDIERKFHLMMTAAEQLISLSSADAKDLLDGLADRPRPGAKVRARAALTAHLKDMGEFRKTVSGLKYVEITGSDHNDKDNHHGHD